MFLTDRFFLKKYVKKFLSFFQLAILFSVGSKPSDGVGGGGAGVVIQTLIDFSAVNFFLK